MEQTPNTFAAAQHKQRRRRRVRNACIAGAAALAVVIAAAVLIPALTAGGEDASVLTYQAAAVTEGEISASVSGSGTLSALNAASFTAPADATVEEVLVLPGARVSAGDTILTLSSDTLDEELETLRDELESVNESLAGARQEAASRYVTAGRAGVVKEILAASGDIVDDAGALCRIATDGNMRLELADAPDTLRQYDAVSVVIGEETAEGLVTERSGGTAVIVLEDDGYALGAAATAYDADGGLLGTGTLALNEYVEVAGTAGRIESVLVEEGDSVSRGSRLFELAEGAPDANYLSLKEQQADLRQQVADCEAQYSVVAEWDALVTSLPVAAGDELAAGDALCTLAGVDGYTMDVSVDELDIASVQLDQAAAVTLDAVEGTFSGRVASLSYEGSGSYVTSYTAKLEIDPIDGALPGMSASAEIVTATSGQTLIVPVEAVQYEDGQAFVYLAPEGAAAGASYAGDAVDTAALSRTAVETGMSDGSYVAVTGELAAGDLILVPVRTTTAEYDSGTQTTGGFGGFGGMGGREMPGSFPGEMPDGAFSGGGGFGGMQPGA